MTSPALPNPDSESHQNQQAASGAGQAGNLQGVRSNFTAGEAYAELLDTNLKEVAFTTRSRLVKGEEATSMAIDHWTELQPLYLNHVRELCESMTKAGLSVNSHFFVPQNAETGYPVFMLEIKDKQGNFIIPGAGFIESTAQIDDLRTRNEGQSSNEKQVMAGLEFEYSSQKLGFPVEVFKAGEPIWLLVKYKEDADRSYATEAMYSRAAYERALGNLVEASQSDYRDLKYSHLYHEVAAPELRQAIRESDLGSITGAKELLSATPPGRLDREILELKFNLPTITGSIDASFQVHFSLIRGRPEVFADLIESKPAEYL